MSKTKSIKRPVIAMPKNLDEAAEFLSLIGQERRKIDKVQSTLNDNIETLKTAAMSKIQPHEEQISKLVEGLFVFAEGSREKLTDGGKRKTVELPTGLFGWRLTPPAISIRDIKSVLAKLKELGLKYFIRVKPAEEEINKEAMLKEPELAKTVRGVSITQREEFIVKPTEIEIEIVSSVEKLKKTLT